MPKMDMEDIAIDFSLEEYATKVLTTTYSEALGRELTAQEYKARAAELGMQLRKQDYVVPATQLLMYEDTLRKLEEREAASAPELDDADARSHVSADSYLLESREPEFDSELIQRDGSMQNFESLSSEKLLQMLEGDSSPSAENWRQQLRQNRGGTDITIEVVQVASTVPVHEPTPYVKSRDPEGLHGYRSRILRGLNDKNEQFWTADAFLAAVEQLMPLSDEEDKIFKMSASTIFGLSL